jgi:hypothetical protein
VETLLPEEADGGFQDFFFPCGAALAHPLLPSRG